jgi:uroporphyrin-3 C-methyltransferase
MTDKPEADISSVSKKSDDVKDKQQQKLDQLKEEVQESATKKATSSTSVSDAVDTTEKKIATPKAPKSKNQVTQPIKTKALWLVTLFNLLLILSLAGGGYWFWQQTENQKHATQTSINQQFQSQQQQLDSALVQSLKQLNDNTSDALKPVFDQLNTVSLKADATQASISEISGRRPSDWLLAEADYLVRMAGRKLWLENDTPTAVLMLQTADQRLADINDPSLIPIRELIASDIVNVQQVNQVPITAIALKITGLIKSVDSLPLDMVNLPEAEDSVVNDELTDSVSDWRANLYRSWRKIADDFVSVRRRTDSIQPLMSAQQQWLTREKLKHYLLQSQTALLSNDQVLFSEFLGLAADSISLFDEQNYRVSSIKRELDSLKQTDIKQNYPSRLEAQLVLEDALKARTRGIVPALQSSPL